MKNKLYSLILVIAFIFLFNSCRNSPHPESAADLPQMTFARLEKDLFTADPAKVGELISFWQNKYGLLFNHFCSVIRIGNPEDENFTARMKEFLTAYPVYTLYKRTVEVFPDLDTIELKINRAFTIYRQNFPGMTIPALYTFISGFNQSAITDDSLLAIGLDKYLGTSEELYRQAGVYQYLLDNMYPGRIVSDAMSFWAETEFAFNDSVDNLIAAMIYRGRLIYFTQQMLPDEADSVVSGFSNHQLSYLTEHEKNMWTYLIENKFLFNTDKFTIDKFILEGPFTKDFGRDSPARAAVWIGYRIVKDYMSKNRKVTLQQLMQERNYMNILRLSAYNP